MAQKIVIVKENGKTTIYESAPLEEVKNNWKPLIVDDEPFTDDVCLGVTLDLITLFGKAKKVENFVDSDGMECFKLYY